MIQPDFSAAVTHFRQARREAALERIVTRLKGEQFKLLSYEEVRQRLKGKSKVRIGLQDIPIKAIIGSVGRHSDFSRSFLPLKDSDRDRWARVSLATMSLSGLPPIEVYQIGDTYFVLDGHHRLSVARQLGATHIQAYVTEIITPVALTPEDRPNDLMVKYELADFLEQTKFNTIRPGVELRVTVPEYYQVLKEHIDVHRYFMGIERQREIPYEEAVAHWYEAVYLPVVQLIRIQGILQDFPGRTETDLYIWVLNRRAELQETLGWEVDMKAAADDLVEGDSPLPRRVATRITKRIKDALLPDKFESGPPVGEWREERTDEEEGILFRNILVPVSGKPTGWEAFSQALDIAHRDGSRLLGLCVVPAGAQITGKKTQSVREEFERRCQEAGVAGSLTVEPGKVARKIVDRARWADLVALSLTYPPEDGLFARLGSGFRSILVRCPRPVLAVPAPSLLGRPLLAFDGSPKAWEALFLTTYMAGRWNLPLVVLTVIETEGASEETLKMAQRYLESYSVPATYEEKKGSVPEAILDTCQKYGCDWLIMGGYGHHPVVQAIIGDTVSHMLRLYKHPILICR
ncbi:MAG: universal stress protein [Chloroflexota bacterium]